MYQMMKKKWTKFSKELVNTLLIISESQYSFTSHTSFKIFKIILYFFQLQGYVYSQYESKPLIKSDILYFTSFTQNASMTFWMFTLQDDEISMAVFYVMITSHILLYIMIIIFSIIKIDFAKLVYGIWNFFFLNFIWIFLTPLQEVSIGMIVCGQNSFIKIQKQQQCYVSPIHVFFGSFNTILILLSGFMSLYFFRSYRFNSIDFLRKYESKDLLYVILHQIIIIEYYLNFSFLDYIKHTMMHILFLLLIYEALTSFPFGFYLEAILYTVIVCLNEWFMLLLSIWLFSKLDSNFILITFFIMIPIISGVAKFMVNNLNLKLMLNLQAQKFNQNVDTYLEEIYRIASEYYYNTQSKVKFMLIMKSHTNKCNDIKCPCTQNSQIFIDQSNNVSRERLNQWTKHIFDQALKLSLLRQKLYCYENFSLKYNTFLEQYQNNPILAYGILQDIMKNQGKRQKSNQFQVSFYFISLFYVLTRRYRQKIEQVHKKQQMTKFEYDLLNDIKILQEHQKRIINVTRKFLKKQIEFWNRYKSSQFMDFNHLSKGLFTLVQQNNKFVKAFNFIDGQINSIYILRLKILVQFCKDKNFSSLEYLIKQLNSFIQEEHQDNDGTFKSIYFNNQRAISLVANMSGINQGEVQKNSQARQFFSLPNNIELKNINQIIPQQLAEQHKNLMDNYFHSGYVSNNLNSIIKGYCLNGFGFIEPINICITPYFQTKENEYNHFLMAHIMKQNIYNMQVSTQSFRKQGAILLSGTFQIIGITDYLFNKIMKHSKNIVDLKDFIQKISIFQLIPNLGDYLFEYYETKQKYNQRDFLTEEIGTFNTTLNYFLSKDVLQQYKTDFYSIKERVKILEKIKNECITEQVDLMYQEIKLQIMSNCFKYNKNYNLQYYPFYELVIETSKKNKIIKKNQKVNDMKINELEIQQIQSQEQIEHEQFDFKKDHITISERIFSDNNAGVQLNESNLTSYLSSQSQNNQLSEFYRYVNLKNFKGVNLYFWSSLIFLVLITIFSILLIVVYSQMLDNKSYCQQFQYKLYQLNDQYSIIRQTIIHHQFITENPEYLINNTIKFQNFTLPLIKYNFDNICQQQLIKALTQFQIIYQQSKRFFFQIMEDGDSLLLSHQVQNNKIIIDIVETQQLLQILLQLFYDLNINSSYQQFFTVARNYKPFVDNIMNIIQKKCPDQLENSDSQQLLIILVLGYISIILIQLQLIYSIFQTNKKHKQVLKIFHQTDYSAACCQLYQLEQFYNFFQIKNILFDGKSTDKFIQQQFKATENQNYNFTQGSHNYAQNEPQSFRDIKYKIEEINERLSAFWPLFIQCFILISNIMQFFTIQIIIQQTMQEYVQKVNYGLAVNQFKSSFINILVDWDSIIYQNYDAEKQFYFYYSNITNLMEHLKDFKTQLYHSQMQSEFLNINCDCLDTSRVFQSLNYKFIGTNQDFITSSIQQIIENGYASNASIINQQDYFIYYIWGFDYIINILNSYSNQYQNEIYQLQEYLKYGEIKLLIILLLIFFFWNIALLLIINQYSKRSYQNFLKCLRFVPTQIVLKFKLNQKLRELT